MAKKCTAYGPRIPEEHYISEFLEFTKDLERMTHERKKIEFGDEDWKKFSEQFAKGEEPSSLPEEGK